MDIQMDQPHLSLMQQQAEDRTEERKITVIRLPRKEGSDWDSVVAIAITLAAIAIFIFIALSFFPEPPP
jgi:hypothetical protein